MQAEVLVHRPVLAEESPRLLVTDPNGVYVDGTFGRGGHSRLILEKLSPQGRLIAFDRDEEAVKAAAQIQDPRFQIIHAPFASMKEELAKIGIDKVTGIFLDIGVSSPQIDDPERGFSFRFDGPLDMRMDQHSGAPSAWHWVNRENFDRLKECIATLGEEPQAGRIARAIVDARQKSPIDTTAQLAALVEKAYPPAWRAKARRHPATRTFQALRMAVNDELGELRRFLDAILGRLSLGGRLAVISFHSLEDRMVKQTMRYWAEGCRCPRHVPVCVCHHVPEVEILYKKPVQADDDELAVNPRASSAKLRAVEKIAEAVS